MSQHDDEHADQDGEKALGQRQIMDLTHCVGRSGSLVLVFDGDGDRERTAQSRNRLLNRVGASSV